MVSMVNSPAGAPGEGLPSEEKKRSVSRISFLSETPSEELRFQNAFSRFVVPNGVEEVLMRRFIKFKHTLCAFFPTHFLTVEYIALLNCGPHTCRRMDSYALADWSCFLGCCDKINLAYKAGVLEQYIFGIFYGGEAIYGLKGEGARSMAGTREVGPTSWMTSGRWSPGLLIISGSQMYKIGQFTDTVNLAVLPGVTQCDYRVRRKLEAKLQKATNDLKLKEVPEFENPPLLVMPTHATYSSKCSSMHKYPPISTAPANLPRSQPC
eukprot:6749533-Pyramimonas_sp.AAC.1